MVPSHTLTGRALDYAEGVAVNGVYSPAKVDRKAGWFRPRTSIATHGYSRIVPAFHDDPGRNWPTAGISRWPRLTGAPFAMC